MNNNEVFSLIEERVKGGNSAALTVTGNSMAPLLKHGKTIVTLVAPSVPLKKNGIYLYKRENGSVILHRAVKIGKETADFRGDAERVTEKGVPFNVIIAQAVIAEIDGKSKKLYGIRHSLYGTWRGIRCIISRFKAHLTRKTK